jgi:hypothetical protein
MASMRVSMASIMAGRMQRALSWLLSIRPLQGQHIADFN